MSSYSLGDLIAKKSIQKYASLPKSGKPVPLLHQWTLLSTLIMENKISGELDVITLGTGSKCMGRIKYSAYGDAVIDSHAEILCRRGFVL